MMDTITQTDREPATAAVLGDGSDAGPAWLQSLREKAKMRLGEIGFPTTSHEEWRFTNVAQLQQWVLHTASPAVRRVGPADIEPFLLARDGYCLVFVDGQFRQDLSNLPIPGVALKVGSLRALWNAEGRELENNLARHARFDENYFTALNTADFQDGAFIAAAANAVVEQPIQLLYLAASERPHAVVHARNLIVAHHSSSLKVIETYASLTEAPHLTNAVTELVLGPDAHVEHCKLQNENEHAFHISTTQAVQARSSRWLSHSIATGARLARNQIQTLLNAEGAEGVLNGLYFARGQQLIDHHTVVDHAQPRCESHEFYYGILSDRAHGVFNGKIFVRQDAQKTNAKQTNRNLVLSETALINTKPQLEIFADDVKCTHGATVGQLNEEALFYLQARGIGVDLARRMLIRAFANDAVERITLPAVREHLEKLLTERFEGLNTSVSSHGQ
jgi:Fe-S cluster assembly protein SufD